MRRMTRKPSLTFSAVKKTPLKRLICCLIALIAAALVIGYLVYIASGGMSPARKLMKEHPYAYRTEKSLGKEVQKSYLKDKKAAVYTAYPKTGNKETDAAIADYLSEAKEALSSFMKEEKRIPRLVFDYTTQAGEDYTTLSLFYELAGFTEDGQGEAALKKERTLYIGSENRLLGLDDLLGENAEKKLETMLKASGGSLEGMESFTLAGDILTLCWADRQQEFSAHAVRSASLIDPAKPMIALTFDDGPGRYSRQFADLLARFGGHGTFFVLGVNVSDYDQSLKYVYDMGNEIGSHTHSHKDLNKLSESAVREELDKAAEAIHDAIGAYPTLVRAPYGNANDKVMSVIGGPMIKWSVDTEDWRTRNAEAIKKVLLEQVKDGDIVLLHEIYQPTLEGLEMALEELSREGYQFVTVSELMHYRGVEPEVKHYYSCYPAN